MWARGACCGPRPLKSPARQNCLSVASRPCCHDNPKGLLTLLPWQLKASKHNIQVPLASFKDGGAFLEALGG